MQKQLMTSSRDDWESPPLLFEEIDNIFHFGLDAAASPENALCDKFLTTDCRYFYMAEFDALSASSDWLALSEGKPIWINPPYGNGILLPFFRKIKQEYEKGATIVCLVAARTETKWHKIAWDYARYFLFFNTRLKFELKGVPQGTATFPSELIVFSPKKWNLYSLQHWGKIFEQGVVTQQELMSLL